MRALDRSKIAAVALLTAALLVLAILLFAEGQPWIAGLFALAAVWGVCETVHQYNDARWREYLRGYMPDDWWGGV